MVGPPSSAVGRFAAGHLGELTRIVSFDLVDAAIDAARATQRRVRVLPSRVVVYVLLAGVLFTGTGYRGVWSRLAAGIGLPESGVAAPGSSALSQAMRRIGPGPLRELFALLRGPAPGEGRWRGLLVCAIDGTSMFAPDSAANSTAFGRQTGRPDAPAGYAMVRLLAVIACGSRTVLDAVFGPYGRGETRYAPALFGCLGPRMILLGDRNFAATTLIEQIAATRADLLIRCKDNRRLPPVAVLGDGTWLTQLGTTLVRVIDARIRVSDETGAHRHAHYRLITTLTDHDTYPARALVELYHQRWEIETTYRELKSTILDGRVLRARTPAGISQEIYAVLVVYQALRTVIADAALTAPGTPIDRLSFSIALRTARDQIHRAAACLTSITDLAGQIGHAVLTDPLPARRARSCPRVVKRAISKHRAKGHIDRINHTIQTETHLLPAILTQPPDD